MLSKSCPSCGMQVDADSKHCSHCGAIIIPSSGKQVQSGPHSQDSSSPIGGLQGNIQVIAVIEIALGIIAGLVSLSMFSFFGDYQQGMGAMMFGMGGAMFGMGGGMMNMMGMMGSMNTMMGGFELSGSTIHSGMSLLVLVYGGAMLLFGLGLYFFKEWGRFGSMVIGAVSLFFIPIGTIFGAVTLYLLSRPNAPDLFKK